MPRPAVQLSVLDRQHASENAAVVQGCVPFVIRTWAWCSSRSTVAVAMLLGISSSKPDGWMLELIAIERFS